MASHKNKMAFLKKTQNGNTFISKDDSLGSLSKKKSKIITGDTETSAFSMYSSVDSLSNKKRKRKSNDHNKKNKSKQVIIDIDDLMNGKNKITKVSTPKSKKTKKSHSKEIPSNNHTFNRLSNKNVSITVSEPELIIQQTSSNTEKLKPENPQNKIYSEKLARQGSLEQGRNMLGWIINSYSVEVFFRDYWEKKPLFIERKNADYYKSIISGSVIDDILRTQNVMYSVNLDITTYEDGKRLTHNPIGRALPHAVWDFYSNGCSVRLLNPQTFVPKVHLLNATLQDYFNCFIGANVYLTPPNSQGFAPHYDDIEAFILQIEGKKLWRIYKPLTPNEELPRFSSRDFTQEEIGSPIMEVTVSAGDFLYFPRGFIHQAVTVDGEHSLHVTLSACQKHSWGDLFDKMLPKALQSAMQEDKEFRKSLPLDLYANTGFVHSESTTQRKAELVKHVGTLFNKICKHLKIDDAVDEISKEFLHSALPPIVSENERNLTVFGDSDVFMANGKIKNKVDLELDTEIRLLRANIIRMIPEDGTTRLYHIIENSKVYRENEIQYLEIDDAMIPAVSKLILSYPKYVLVKDLDVENDDEKLGIASDLWERGLLMTKKPLSYMK